MELWQLALAGLGAGLTLMTLAWVGSVIRTDASLVDRFWGPVFVVYALVYALLSDGYVGRRVVIAAIVAIWGLRLAAYITWRNWGEDEDKRYQRMRSNNPETFKLRSLVTIFWGQCVLAWVISLPLLAAAHAPTPDHLIWLDFLGIAVWAIGFYFEAVGDWQLSRFLADPDNRGKVMNHGLWRYTRHPNYFGDVTVWWAFWLVALATGAWWSVLGPILFTFFIIRVSGVAMTDRDMGKKGSTREGYEEYVRRTNTFFPGPPKPAA